MKEIEFTFTLRNRVSSKVFIKDQEGVFRVSEELYQDSKEYRYLKDSLEQYLKRVGYQDVKVGGIKCDPIWKVMASTASEQKIGQSFLKSLGNTVIIPFGFYSAIRLAFNFLIEHIPDSYSPPFAGGKYQVWHFDLLNLCLSIGVVMKKIISSKSKMEAMQMAISHIAPCASSYIYYNNYITKELQSDHKACTVLGIGALITSYLNHRYGIAAKSESIELYPIT